MAKDDYIPRDDAGRVALLTGFREVIGQYAGQLGLSAGDLAAQAADAAWADYILHQSLVMKAYGKQWTSYRRMLFLGSGTAVAPAFPHPPETVPATVAPGVLFRFRALVRRIKTAPGYTEATGLALGIVGTQPTAPDPATLAPLLKVRVEGEHVILHWKKGGNEALHIDVDRGTGKWELLAIALHPDTTDPEPFPAIPAKWRYRACYISKGKPHGQLSNIAEITVGG